jgi:hypothetical protein
MIASRPAAFAGRPCRDRGIALLVTLAMVVLLTILVIGFAVSMRMSRFASRNYNDWIQARLAAESAVSDALAVYRDATPPLSITNSWVTAPGCIYTIGPAGVVTNPMHSQTQILPNSSWNSDTNNLNDGGLITGVNTLYPATALIRGLWVTQGTNGSTAGISGAFTNLITSRYNWWADDESAKVNVNVAKLRDPAPVDESALTNLDLRALEPPFNSASATVLQDFWAAHSAPNPPFTTLEEMRLGNATWPNQTPATFASNQFFVTVYSEEPDVDAFGRARVDVTHLTDLLANALPRLGEDYWATLLYPRQVTDSARNTLTKKYGLWGAQQILVNALDYQRPVTDAPAAPVGVIYDPTSGIPNQPVGLKKGPLLSAILVHVATNAVADPLAPLTTTNVAVSVQVDVKLVNGYELPRGNGYWLKINLLNITALNSNAAAAVTFGPNGEQTRQLTNDIPANSFGLLSQLAVSGPAQYDFTVAGLAGGGAPAVTNLSVQLEYVVLRRSVSLAADILDWMHGPKDFAAAYPGPAYMVFHDAQPLGGRIVPTAALSLTTFGAPGYKPLILAKSDPRTRSLATTPGAGDLAPGAPTTAFGNNWSAYGPADCHPLADDTITTSYNSRLSPATYKLLANARATGGATPSQRYLAWTNATGQVVGDVIAERPMTSIGELGYLHTGYPWRTVRLASVYPQTTNLAGNAFADRQLDNPWTGIGDANYGTGTNDLRGVETNAVPDWVLLDLFTIGSNTTVAGRVNINGRLTDSLSNLTARTPPLAALFRHCSTTHDTARARTLASNVLARVLVAGSPYTNQPAFFTRGELCEVRDLGWFSETTDPAPSQRRQLLRRVANLTTTRSTAFTIWARGQSLWDRDRDGRFDWSQVIPVTVTPTNAMAGTGSYTEYVIVDGDGDGDAGGHKLGRDFINSQVRLQAVIRRELDSGNTPRYRVIYTRFYY